MATRYLVRWAVQDTTIRGVSGEVYARLEMRWTGEGPDWHNVLEAHNADIAEAILTADIDVGAYTVIDESIESALAVLENE